MKTSTKQKLAIAGIALVAIFGAGTHFTHKGANVSVAQSPTDSLNQDPPVSDIEVTFFSRIEESIQCSLNDYYVNLSKETAYQVANWALVAASNYRGEKVSQMMTLTYPNGAYSESDTKFLKSIMTHILQDPELTQKMVILVSQLQMVMPPELAEIKNDPFLFKDAQDQMRKNVLAYKTAAYNNIRESFRKEGELGGGLRLSSVAALLDQYPIPEEYLKYTHLPLVVKMEIDVRLSPVYSLTQEVDNE